MTKTITASGPNGTFNGTIIIKERAAAIQSKNPVTKEKETRKVNVFDVVSLVNGHPFGQVAKNIQDLDMVNVEVQAQELRLSAHINRMANLATTKKLHDDLSKLGFQVDTRITKRTSKAQSADSKITNLDAFIKKHTKKVGELTPKSKKTKVIA